MVSRNRRLFCRDAVQVEAGRLALEISHERLGARVERIDDHLPIGRSGDLDAVHVSWTVSRKECGLIAAVMALTVCPRDPAQVARTTTKGSLGCLQSQGGT
jgi:hypothetical protein